MLTLNFKENRMELSQIRKLVELELKTELNQPSRDREIVYARNLYFKLARDYTNFSFYKIADELGKTHATAMHGYKTCTEVMLKYDIKFIKAHKKISRILSGIINIPLKLTNPEVFYREKYKQILLDHRALISNFREVHSELSKIKGMEVHCE